LQKQLQLLIELQDIERRIQVLESRKTQTPQEIDALRQEVESVERQRDQTVEMLAAAKRSRSALEQEVEDLERRRKKSKEKLLAVKSNREYQAILKEIDELGNLIREKEDLILEKMETLEQLHTKVKQVEGLVKKARQRQEKEGSRLLALAAEADALIAELEQKREAISPKIADDLLKRYQFLKKHRGGTAMAPVNAGICQVCHMNLPPQMFIELQKNEQLLQCPNCQRIMYWLGHKEYQKAPLAEALDA